MTWAREELGRRREAYHDAVARWQRARAAGGLIPEEDDRQRAAGVKWRAVDAVGRAALSGLQLAKSELDHIAARVRREAGNDSCAECEQTARRMQGNPTMEQLENLRPAAVEQLDLPPGDDEIPF